MKKYLLFSIILLFFSNKIYRVIWNKKYNNYTKNYNLNTLTLDKNEKKNCINALVLENNFFYIIINKGLKDGVKNNMLCEGENGFIGLIVETQENYSIIKTFWDLNWNIILLDGNNNYGFLKNNGFFLVVLLSDASPDKFKDNQEVFFVYNNKKSILGTVIYWKKNIYKIRPKENIHLLKKIYIR